MGSGDLSRGRPPESLSEDSRAIERSKPLDCLRNPDLGRQDERRHGGSGLKANHVDASGWGHLD